MKANLHKRLVQLESVATAARKAREAGQYSGQAVEKIRAFLRAHAIEPLPNESLAETTARALGISCIELRDQLRALACAQQ